MRKLKLVFLLCLFIFVVQDFNFGRTPIAKKSWEDITLKLAVDISDGSHIIGVPELSEFLVHTSYGKMKVPIEEVLSINIREDHKSAAFTMRNGDKIRGVLTMRPLKLKTVFGPVTISIEHIRYIQVLSGKGLVLYYTFESNKTEVEDKSRNLIHGTINGATWVKTGEGQGALMFNNPAGQQKITEFVSIPYSTSIQALENSSFTIAIRYRSTDNSQENGRLWGNRFVSYTYNAGRTPYAYCGVVIEDRTYHVGEPPLDRQKAITTDGLWHWHVLVFDRDALTLSQYIDGVLTGKNRVMKVGRIPFDNLVLGATKPNDTYGARATTVSQLRIYRNALADSQVKELCKSL
jgi:hypothetical protein